jgi:hypothetical protein
MYIIHLQKNASIVIKAIANDNALPVHLIPTNDL